MTTRITDRLACCLRLHLLMSASDEVPALGELNVETA